MLPQKRAIFRFLKYSIVGGSTFLFDLALLFVLVDIFHLDPILSAGGAFLIAVSINYLISRRLVFRGTKRTLHTGYGIFLLITGIGAAVVMGLMALFVNVFDWSPLPSRVAIALVVGIWNYLMNLYVNFRIAGEYYSGERN
ncbi:MAG: GtrA family protein [Patescibacteria group bacterium]